ncbi:hypothetical protein [Timonella senegalensis]|uniref:hypothetical protein n=1 Tax=Timonella senegalensis TaxID=1465825 RepID=UPI000304D4F9|nr:hypothetical protein [Timonella senegalensis]
MNYTPTTKQVREWYTHRNGEGFYAKRLRSRAQEFDRWLAEHDREVKAQALEEAADDVWAQFGPTVMGPGDLDDVYFPEWLRARAQQLKEEA